MMDRIFLESPHRRWNPLSGSWTVVSPHRTQRPWQGQTEDAATPQVPTYDPTCYLCPGNLRANGDRNPVYTQTFAFRNDYSALLPDTPQASYDLDNQGLLRAETEPGLCRVLCFSPRHDLTLATMEVSAIAQVVDLWTTQYAELAVRPEIAYVQIFENRGAMMGASNPHPHCQIWATSHLPDEPALELTAQRAYFTAHQQPLLEAYLALELQESARIVAQTDFWVALVPFWAVWPFELLILPRRSVPTLLQLTEPERHDLAQILSTVTQAYNRVFSTPFPYSMGLHPAPADGGEHPEWTLHFHFYPPLLRSATVRKFMVGFELLGSPQRDITPELAAQTLRACVHPIQGAS